MNWKDVKLATLQKMFAAEGNTIPNDESTADYLAGMPYVANEALQRLSTAGKFIIKTVDIAHIPLVNLLGKEPGESYFAKSFLFTAKGAKSYFFNFSGKGTLYIKVDDEIENEIDLDSRNVYTEYRGLIEGDGEVTLEIECPYPCAICNVTLYDAAFESEDEIPDFAENVRYPLKDLCKNFYQLDEGQIYYEGTQISSRCYRESDSVLVLDRRFPGKYTIYYRAYPEEITANTNDDYELPLDKEVAVLMPLYMASQLYKDDDNGIATAYRNEFEIALESLIDSSYTLGPEEFVSESGWI